MVVYNGVMKPTDQAREPNTTVSHHYETISEHEIHVWKERVSPEKPVTKTGKPLKGGVQRYTWIGYVDGECIANEPMWQGGTKHEALKLCREWVGRKTH